MAAAGLTFTFAFTSFALVRWLAPDTLTLEVLLAEQGSGAGIPVTGLTSAGWSSVPPWLKRRFF